MGRLTLNVLLSFAQFEREVIGERIRDKIAASKRKGMWMGGVPPLGYRAEDRKLLVIDSEAEIVRSIFRRYAELGSVRLLKQELDARGIKSKSWTSASGRPIGGKPFSRGALYLMLQNRTYLGEIVHKGQFHPGEHAPIVDQPLWDAVHSQLAGGREWFCQDRCASRLEAEILLLQGAHRRWMAQHGRSSVGLSGFAIGDCARYVADWLSGKAPPSPSDGFSAPLILRFAVDDLKAYSLEAAGAGAAKPSSRQLTDWFWNETGDAGAAIHVLREVRRRTKTSGCG